MMLTLEYSMSARPTWSLTRLPDELLLEIVAKCVKQDRRLTERRRLFSRGVGPGLSMEVEPSLKMLSRTCRRIRSLCVPKLFSVVSVKNGAEAGFRQFFDHFRTHFRTLDLTAPPESSTPNQLGAFIILVATATGIDSVEVAGRFLLRASLLAKRTAASIAWRTILGRIRELSITRQCDVEECAAILQFVNCDLVKLALEWPTSHRSTEDESFAAVNLISELGGFPKLTELSLKAKWAIPMTSLTHVRTLDDLPLPLTKLTLAVNCVEESTRTLIAQFRSTLESLTLITYEDADSWNLLPPIFTSPFPALTHLTVVGTCTRYMSTPPAMTPSLRHLLVRPRLEKTSEVASFLAGNFISNFPNLVSIDLFPIDITVVRPWLEQEKPSRLPAGFWPRLTYDDTLAFDPVLRQLGLARGRHSYDVMLTSDYEEFLWWTHCAPIGAAEYFARREGPVEELLDFLLEHNRMLRVTKDVAGRKALAKALHPLFELFNVLERVCGGVIDDSRCPIEATCKSGLNSLDVVVAAASVEGIGELVRRLREAQLLKELQED
ncbi:hypothetical protein JCM11491_002010 [Sporobolomyces phaffii]